MPGGGKFKYIPPTQEKVYNDNTKVAPQVLPKEEPVKDFLNTIKPKPKSLVSYVPNSVLKTADVATDIMQTGNFIPHPAAQTIGKIGNVLGAGVDAMQAVKAFDEGDNTSAAINAASGGQ